MDAKTRKLQARQAFDFLRSSELVNLDMPVAQLAESVSRLEEVAGYVLAWDKYVLVVADFAADTINPVAHG